ncbi:MAG: penicillin-binding protein 2 [Deltaproteobacteria bacterium]|nr:MAG: penicillin-binding protein 2 [Deltaproteobacteria bacterium]
MAWLRQRDLVPHDPEEKGFRLRFRVAFGIITAIFALLVFRLWYLQLFQGAKFRQFSQENHLRTISIPAPRGMILDRKGRILADNRPSFDLYIIPEDIGDQKEVLGRLGKILKASPQELENRLKDAEAKGIPRFKQFKLRGGISWEELAKIEANLMDLPGIIVQVGPQRYYPHSNLASHLIGYLAEIDKEELRALGKSRFRRYQLGDLIGRYGVEEKTETYLRGEDGGKTVQVDALGRTLPVVLNEIESTPGKNIVLTIDLDLQAYTERIFAGKLGSVIAMDPQNGEVLAMLSNPSFNPGLFARDVSKQEWERLRNDPLDPLENKSIRGQYPPGSTYKLIVAAAAVEEEAIAPKSKLICKGSYRLGRRSYGCWRWGGHGAVNLYQALVQSCDVYFYQVGRRLGIDTLAEYAWGFGLGEPTGIDLSNEKAGLVPTSTWKLETTGEEWLAGETLSAAIGQSFNLVTPIQLLNAYCAVANGGKLMLPRVVQKIETVEGEVVKDFPSREIGALPASPETLDFLKKALAGVVSAPRGTGWAARIGGVSVAGKTGTAQVISQKVKSEEIPFELRDHAWFVAFSPVEEPEIAVVVLVEHGGHGGKAAAPIARKVIQKYFEIKAEKDAGPKISAKL